MKLGSGSEGFPFCYLREIKILMSLNHPLIVNVQKVVVDDSVDGFDNVYMVMDYVEHDLRALMKARRRPFIQSEVKCLMLQLLEGVKYLHDNWVFHRDLKTANILFNNMGEVKICDFGMSCHYGRALKPYTSLVVTLWYRAPELLLGAKEYSTAVDMWAVGCIMAELLTGQPLFEGKTEFEQIAKIFNLLGTPNDNIWEGYSKLPGVKVNFVHQPYNLLHKKFPRASFIGSPTLSNSGLDLLSRILTYDPEKRITAKEALNHCWFQEVPLLNSKEFMPTFPPVL
uniref:Protein kinase domain-containing protein n=2 Tax=Chenopodium quinoa TaxID=63459 RepID=A0A803KNG6_CHEQI